MAKVTANEIESFRPVHPGELLKDELEYRHLSQKAVAKQLGLPYTAFNEILNGKRPVTTDFALFMEAALGVPAYMLVGMQTDYNLQVAKKDPSIIDRLAEIRKVAVML
ncbi:MAG: HigA family addiction module antidote protein [Tannerellaceae bacterium]|jgi:addiction module HigA family antidote|nr:HigA family addiction module antidote protein [Tannerellaceae bacterium]